MPRGNQALQIFVCALNRHAAHRDIITLMLAALCEHNTKRLRGDLSIFKEELVEITHPIEQKTSRIGSLDLDILRHHRRNACVSRRRGILACV